MGERRAIQNVSMTQNQFFFFLFLFPTCLSPSSTPLTCSLSFFLSPPPTRNGPSTTQSILPETAVPAALGLRVPASALAAFSVSAASVAAAPPPSLHKAEEVKKVDGGAPSSLPPPHPPPASLPLFLLDSVSVYRRAAPGAPREPVSLLEIAGLLSGEKAGGGEEAGAVGAGAAGVGGVGNGNNGDGGGDAREAQPPPPRVRIRASGTLVDHHAAASLSKGGLAAARSAPLRFCSGSGSGGGAECGNRSGSGSDRQRIQRTAVNSGWALRMPAIACV